MKKNKLIIGITTLFTLLSQIIIYTNIWIYHNFGNVKIDEILFTLLSPTDGTDMKVVFSYIFQVLILSIIITVLFLIILRLIKKRNNHKYILTRNISILLVIVVFLSSILYTENRFEVIKYFKSKNEKTTIYEQKEIEEESDGDETIIYQDPTLININGEDTNNLLYIYLESYENSFLDEENGGVLEVNCLPELTALAKNNISFSNTDKLGGAIPFTGTTWTIASMVGQQAGLPLKVEVANRMNRYEKFMPGAKTIGDILHEQGYLQKLMIGSNKTFAGTDKFFLQHGYDEIYDYNTYVRSHSLRRVDRNEFGLDDCVLLEYAKEELTKLGSQDQKFSFTLATIDCHTPSGYTCDNCPNTYSNRYLNIYACQSKLINSFIDWCKEQSWYDNTTIVLVGDHPTMAQTYTKDFPSDYQRTTYNCIINSKVKTKKIKNRLFSQMDMYPTTLAAMGFEIEGNKLAMGTNLFSKLPTVLEKYGIEYLNNEVQKSSEYLDTNIYQFK